MALSSKLFTSEGPGKAVLARCAETHAGHLLRGMSTNAAIKDAVGRVQSALRQLGIPVLDPAGVYGASTEAAVLKFKGPPRNILGPGQKKPDAIVGIQTIHRLDEAIGGGGGAAPATPAVPDEVGSNKWRFTFAGGKPAIGEGAFQLRIESEERADSQAFAITESFSAGDLIGGFKGKTRGRFTTVARIQAIDFSGSLARIFVDKKKGFVNGSVTLTQALRSAEFLLQFAPFQDERGVAGALTSGTLSIHGSMRSQ